MNEWLGDPLAVAQQWLFESIVQPLLYATGRMRYQEEAFDATEWLVLGAVEVALLALVLGACERRWPAEPMVDRRAVRTDVAYTLLHRLGVFPLLAFALLTPLVDAIEAQLRLLGVSRPNLEQWLPDALAGPAASFVIYLVVLDTLDYWIHRGQHRWRWWWELHAVHHSQRQMTMWSDNRNHLLDDLLRDALLAVAALVIGMAPGQYVLLVIAVRVWQSLQHANLRWRFGAALERLVVSPSFHRRHHAIGFGHEGEARGCNFGVLFPWWDQLFGTADFRAGFVPTGIRDQLDGRDYGRGIVAQQWRALQRWFARG